MKPSPKNTALLLCIGITLLTSAAGAQTAVVDKTRASLSACYLKINTAFSKQDAHSALSFCTPDYMRILPNGKAVTRAGMQKNTAQMFGAAKKITSRTTILKLTQNGKNATATVKQVLTFAGTDPSSHKPLSLGMEETDQDLWVQTPSGWKIKKSTAIAQKIKQNGKLIPTK